MTNKYDQREFRNALGCFATGVTIITASLDDKPEGLTANSFSAVSLDKPLVLWCLDKSAPSLPIFLSCAYFAINVLASNQRVLSNQFARPAEDKFLNIDWHPGLGGAPVLDHCLATFECKNTRQYNEGDHWILIGEVQHFSHNDDQPLLFSKGQYAVPAVHPDDRTTAEEQYTPELTL